MTAFRLKLLTKVSHQFPSQWQTEWNKAACWLQHCSAWRLQPCWQMPSRTPITASTSDTEGTASCSTCDAFRPRPRSTLTSSVTSCSLMIVPSMPVVLKTCSTPWTCSPLPVHHLWFYNQHQEDCGNVLTCSRETVPRTNSYRERTESGRLWTSSRTSAAYCLAVCTSKMRLMPGLPRPVWPLAGCAHRCGSARVWVSQWSWVSTMPSSSPLYCMPARPGLSTRGTQRNSVVSISTAFANCWKWSGRTKCPTQRFSSRQECPVSSPCSASHNSAGLDMSPGCLMNDYPSAFSTENCRLECQ